MREKIYAVLNKIYGLLMTVSFFAGVLPIIPFIVAVCVGGELGEAICVFLYEDYYKWVIFGASLAVLIGLVAMYIGKLKALTIKEDK